jgi:transglutaminase-like putative cysteine protease
MRVDYPSNLQPREFKDIPKIIDRDFPRKFPGWVKYSCVMHSWVNKNSDYHRSGSEIPEPSEMMKRLSGDCEDQSVLLGSLMRAADLEIRFIAVDSKKEGHVLVETKPPAQDTELVIWALEKFYEEELNRSVGSISWDEDDDGGKWFLADPVMSDYIGDTGSLERTGYMDKNRDGTWNWRRVKYIQTV